MRNLRRKSVPVQFLAQHGSPTPGSKENADDSDSSDMEAASNRRKRRASAFTKSTTASKAPAARPVAGNNSDDELGTSFLNAESTFDSTIMLPTPIRLGKFTSENDTVQLDTPLRSILNRHGPTTPMTIQRDDRRKSLMNRRVSFAATAHVRLFEKDSGEWSSTSSFAESNPGSFDSSMVGPPASTNRPTSPPPPEPVNQYEMPNLTATQAPAEDELTLNLSLDTGTLLELAQPPVSVVSTNLLNSDGRTSSGGPNTIVGTESEPYTEPDSLILTLTDPPPAMWLGDTAEAAGGIPSVGSSMSLVSSDPPSNLNILTSPYHPPTVPSPAIHPSRPTGPDSDTSADEDEDMSLVTMTLHRYPVEPLPGSVLPPSLTTPANDSSPSSSSESEYEATMEVTECVGGLTNSSQAVPPPASPASDLTMSFVDRSALGDMTMDMTECVGGIVTRTLFSSRSPPASAVSDTPLLPTDRDNKEEARLMVKEDDSDDADASLAMDLTTCVPHMIHVSPRTTRRTSLRTRPATGPLESPAVDDTEELDASMEVTQCIGGIQAIAGPTNAPAHESSDDEESEPADNDDMSMEVTQCLGGIQAVAVSSDPPSEDSGSDMEEASILQVDASWAGIMQEASVGTSRVARPSPGSVNQLFRLSTPWLRAPEDPSTTMAAPDLAESTSHPPQRPTSEATGSPPSPQRPDDNLVDQSMASDDFMADPDDSLAETGSPMTPVLEKAGRRAAAARRASMRDRPVRASPYAQRRATHAGGLLTHHAIDSTPPSAPSTLPSTTPSIPTATPKPRTLSPQLPLTPSPVLARPTSITSTPTQRTPRSVVLEEGSPQITPRSRRRSSLRRKSSLAEFSPTRPLLTSSPPSGSPSPPTLSPVRSGLMVENGAESHTAVQSATSVVAEPIHLTSAAHQSPSSPKPILTEPLPTPAELPPQTVPGADQMNVASPWKPVESPVASPYRSISSGALREPTVQEPASVEPVSLTQFLEMTGIQFIDSLDTTVIQRPPAEAPSAAELGDLSPARRLGDHARVTAALAPALELYQFLCTDLTENIRKGTQTVAKLDAELRINNPSSVLEYLLAPESERLGLELYFKQLKTHARLQSKRTWYTWRAMSLAPVLDAYDRTLIDLKRDQQAMGNYRAGLTNHGAAPLRRYRDRLRDQVRRAQERKTALARCDQEELALLQERVNAQTALVTTRRDELTVGRSEQMAVEARIRSLRDQVEAAHKAINTAKATHAAHQTMTVTDLVLHRQTFTALASLHRVTLTELTASHCQLLYRQALAVRFHRSLLDSWPDTQSGVDLTLHFDQVTDQAGQTSYPGSSQPDPDADAWRAILDDLASLGNDGRPQSLPVRLRSVFDHWDRVEHLRDDLQHLRARFRTTVSYLPETHLICIRVLFVAHCPPPAVNPTGNSAPSPSPPLTRHPVPSRFYVTFWMRSPLSVYPPANLEWEFEKVYGDVTPADLKPYMASKASPNPARRHHLTEVCGRIGDFHAGRM
ncbi:hypothetical protein IWQ60_011028 [Tieghemiomyces parasiticus]|uniref:Spc7 kinetochore protein domain-containing protein n=1 Tax=Tieghemiomyces parasiticus TaxID=78921 RepID=A0A9W7ZRF3_9FUNG|nr:hypothetical protein IWQ60_011028 [Tieghemiomyces parasiticus]